MSNDDIEKQMRELSDRINQLENENKQLKQQVENSQYVRTRHPYYEYKSEANFFGTPLVHIARGVNPETGKKAIARGFIAIGDISFGVFSLGGLAFGAFTFGGVSVGLFSFGGVALALLAAFGGLAISLGIAAGGCAIGGFYALGGSAVGNYIYDPTGQAPNALSISELLNKLLFWK